MTLRQDFNKLAGNLVAVGYNMISFEYPKSSPKHSILCFALYDPLSMIKGRVQSAYIFEYPKDPKDDNIKLKLLLGSIEYIDNMYSPKSKTLLKDSEVIELIRLSYDLIIMDGDKKKKEANGKAT